MKEYDINGVDATFSNQLTDLDQLTFSDAIPVPKGATNGDMIKITYPDVKIIEIRGSFGKGELLGYRTWLGGHHQDYYVDWWNAPYKKGNEDR